MMKRSAIALLLDSQAGPSSWFCRDMPPWIALFLTFLSTRLPISCFLVNKNALSSVESCLLGDKFCCQRRWCCYTNFRLEYKTNVICHNVNTQKVKIARRDRPHILASNQCETFENLLHIDIAPLRSTLSGIWHSKNWTLIFIGIKGPWLC